MGFTRRARLTSQRSSHSVWVNWLGVAIKEGRRVERLGGFSISAISSVFLRWLRMLSRESNGESLLKTCGSLDSEL
jgi:hypothetical protein